MKTIKLTAIAVMLFLAFSCKKGRTRPTPVVNYRQTQTFQNPYKIIRTGVRNNEHFPILKKSAGKNKDIWNDNQFIIFQDQNKINKPAVNNVSQYFIYPSTEMTIKPDNGIK